MDFQSVAESETGLKPDFHPGAVLIVETVDGAKLIHMVPYPGQLPVSVAHRGTSVGAQGAEIILLEGYRYAFPFPVIREGKKRVCQDTPILILLKKIVYPSHPGL